MTKYDNKIPKSINPTHILTSLFIIVLACGALIGCNKAYTPFPIYVTILCGDHYSVVGPNRREAQNGKVLFDVDVEPGYRITGAYGDSCDISDEPSNRQTIAFRNVRFQSTVQLKVEPREKISFSIEFDEKLGTASFESVMGKIPGGGYYMGDHMKLNVSPHDDYRFVGWSAKNYLINGGPLVALERMYDYDTDLGHEKLYANFMLRGSEQNCIIYDFGSGNEYFQDCAAMLNRHPAANTLTETQLLSLGFCPSEDKALIGWQNDKGEIIPLGSRTPVKNGTAVTLLPVWKDYSPKSDFRIDCGKITQYVGIDEEVVIPRAIDGDDIITIGSDAFAGGSGKTYYIPSSVTTIEPNAFRNCKNLTDLWFSDNLLTVSDASFSGCSALATVHIAAYLSPYHIATEFAIKEDLFEIFSACGGKKILITGGSSVHYAYDSDIIIETFPEYNFFNFGLTIGMGAKIWYHLLSPDLGEGDIYVHAPEMFDMQIYSETRESVLTGRTADLIQYSYLYYFAECNWRTLERLKINGYADFFDCFAEFNTERAEIAKTNPNVSYADAYSGPKDEQGQCDDRYGGTSMACCGIEGQCFGSNGNLDFFWNSALLNGAGRHIYDALAERGVKVFYMFAPMNRDNLRRTYSNEDELKAAADRYSQLVRAVLSYHNVTVLTEQYATIFDGKYFVNSDYHIGRPIRSEFTRNFAAALVTALGEPT